MSYCMMTVFPQYSCSRVLVWAQQLYAICIYKIVLQSSNNGNTSLNHFFLIIAKYDPIMVWPKLVVLVSIKLIINKEIGKSHNWGHEFSSWFFLNYFSGKYQNLLAKLRISKLESVQLRFTYNHWVKTVKMQNLDLT